MAEQKGAGVPFNSEAHSQKSYTDMCAAMQGLLPLSRLRVRTRSIEPLSYVCMISGDGMEFIIPEAAARQSKMISSLLDAIFCLPNRGGFGDSLGKKPNPGVLAVNSINMMPRIPLEPLSSRTLELVCRYLLQRSTGDPNSTEEFSLLGELDPLSDEDQDVVSDLLLAADFIDC
ncbi:hypothetical protein TcG_03718 [Trypanosoma cruzi]|uniref:Uncharacterized protein n=2 Tax=Trypanosoma cruzi TaxID=5693 RepID=V5BMS6_TRYCR|nr:hypothetical protein TCDM_05676 [Trypanosoma cruzi Dm28c]KAF8283624.1 hypothetical protein TcBrA4_0055070 [Trypanosoma cruzi]PBJ69364.1 hypothetical protein BCY84_19931 [Trypanosoma cruzi cruzi]PWU92351.1 hypothetical protein C4B63_38g74 [Trypanosoma cruzi]RNF20471.1 hypothetical protein TcG_03718 [Trypanosoma cruzi]